MHASARPAQGTDGQASFYAQQSHLGQGPGQEIVCERQRTDLGAEFLHIDGRRRFGLAVAASDFGCPFQKLIAPRRDLIGVDVELLGQFC